MCSRQSYYTLFYWICGLFYDKILTDSGEEYVELENEKQGSEIYGNIIQVGNLCSINGAQDALKALNFAYEETISFITESLRHRKKINLSEVHQYVENHYTEPISLETIAKLFYVSKEYLSKAYKMQFGENLMDHIKRLRMMRAKQLIMEKRIQINHIALSVGYEDVSYFYKVFKKYFGISPNSLREADDQV